jgi:hypothetical protein
MMMFKRIVLAIIITLLLLFIYDGYKTISVQRRLFAAAKDKAKELNRELIVIGAPGGGFWNKVIRGYGGEPKTPDGKCPYICLDMNDCPGEVCSKKYNLDDTALSEYEDDKYVVFESRCIEFSKGAEEAFDNAYRMSGGWLYSVSSPKSIFCSLGGQFIYNTFMGEGVKNSFIMMDLTP